MDSWSFVTCYFSCGAKRGKFWAHPRGQPKRTQKVWEGHLGPYLGGDMGSIVEHVNLQGSNWQNMAKLICILSTNTSFAENVQNEGKNVIPRSQDWMFNPFWLAQLETHSKKNILANHAWTNAATWKLGNAKKNLAHQSIELSSAFGSAFFRPKLHEQVCFSLLHCLPIVGQQPNASDLHMALVPSSQVC